MIMRLLNYRHLWVFTLLAACDSGPTLATLPDIVSNSSCPPQSTDQFSGGDLHLLVDRIFVGEVAKVSFVEEGLSENCDPRMYEWTLRVEFQVQENLKGTGETASVLVSPSNLEWNSVPALKRDGIWLPQYRVPPALELSSTVAWTGESAIQPGQTLLIHAKEMDDGFLFTSGMPWGYPEGDGFRFQNKEWCGYALPQSLQHSFTLETLRGELQKPPLVEYRDNVMQSEYITESKCRPNTQPTVIVGPDMGN